MSRLSEELQIVPIITPEAYGGAGVDSDAIDMSRFSSVTFVFQFGDVTGDSTLICYPGSTNAIAVAKSATAIAFKYRLSAAAALTTLGDTYGDPVAVAYTGLTLTAATFDDHTILIEFDCDQMTTTNRFIVWAVSATANPMDLGCVAIGKPRWPGHTGVTAL
jgi:hypothetical protein